MEKSNYLRKAFGYFVLSIVVVTVGYLGYESGSISTRGNINIKEDDIVGFYGGLFVFLCAAMLCLYYSITELIKYFKKR